MNLPRDDAALARTRTPADRSRVRLTTAALATQRCVRARRTPRLRLGPGGALGHQRLQQLHRRVRPAVRTGRDPVILAALSGGLAVQAFGLGTAARERRLAALGWPVPPSPQVRRLSMTDAAWSAWPAACSLDRSTCVLTALFRASCPRMAQVLFPGESRWDFLAWLFSRRTADRWAVWSSATPAPAISRPPPSHPPGSADRARLVVGSALLVAGATLAPFIGYCRRSGHDQSGWACSGATGAAQLQPDRSVGG